ncbi:MAG: N-acetylmuramoyl-L-alanine amidase [Candidatus Niyogibacteria bacterium]|nr:N-acetylmuramoyl-L-alanine amidase [Candidatus Niyogibacteria bacterium]
MSSRRIFFGVIFFAAVISLWLGGALPPRLLAALAPLETRTPEDLQAKHRNGTLKILIVPGHDNQDYGTEFRDIREADLNLLLAKHLQEFLGRDRQIETVVARDPTTGEYDPTFAKYFTEQSDLITAFITKANELMRSALRSGEMTQKTDGVPHNNAQSRVVKKLYGINKWANENGVDIVLHIHFNDYGGRRYNNSGEYEGFTIYIPEGQFSGSRASKSVAVAVFYKLSKNFGISTLRGEDRGVVEDQKLIAVGANGSLDAAALLIEYGYIYEPQFVRKGIRDSMMRELAYQTYLGVEDYFGEENGSPHTTLLPYEWKNILKKGVKGSRDTLSLQAALRAEGLFPPVNKTALDCPLNGNFGACTEAAVKQFQDKYAADILQPAGLKSGNGVLGLKTMAKLNVLYGSPPDLGRP